MNKMIYTPAIREIIRQVYQRLEAPQAVELLNKCLGLNLTDDRLRSVVACYGLHKRGRRKTGKTSKYNDEHVEFLRKSYAKHDARETCRRFNKRYGFETNWSALRTWMNKHGIFSGNDGKFHAGQKPWNTGTKGLAGANRGSYKPGMLPAKTRPVGSERQTTDGYIEVKVSDAWNPVKRRFGEWRRKNHVVWEQAHGPVPDNHVVTFRNGDRTDCRPENLELVSKSVLCALRHVDFWKQPQEIRPVLMTATQLRMKIHEIEKETA